MPGIALFLSILNQVLTNLRRERGARVGGMREGIGDYSQPIDGVATETRKSVSPSFVCWWSLSLFMSVSVEKYSSSRQLWEKRRFATNAFLFFFVLCQKTTLQWKSQA